VIHEELEYCDDDCKENHEHLTERLLHSSKLSKTN
jgi:hypothetical protein